MEIRKDNIILNIDEVFSDNPELHRRFFEAFLEWLACIVVEFRLKSCDMRRKIEITKVILEAQEKMLKDLLRQKGGDAE